MGELTRRRFQIFKRTAVGLLAVVALLTVYGVAVEPRFILDRRHYMVEIPGLPPDLDGMKVAVFADLQVGMWWANLGMIERVVAEVAAGIAARS